MPINITDVSGNNLHLDNVGAVYNSEGLTPFYSFGGADYLEYNDETIIEYAILGNEAYVQDKGLTLMCWARNTNGVLGGNEAMVSKDNTPSNRQYNIYVDATNVGFHVSTDGTNINTVTTPVSGIVTTDWNFFCGRWVAGGALTVFANDIISSSGSVNAPLFNGNAHFKVGARESGFVASNNWNGDITMVGVYASSLTDDQVLTVFEMTAPLFKPSI